MIRHCIDMGDPLWFKSFCGRVTPTQHPKGIDIHYLDTYFRDAKKGLNRWEWCEDCVNDPRLTLTLLDHLEL